MNLGFVVFYPPASAFSPPPPPTFVPKNQGVMSVFSCVATWSMSWQLCYLLARNWDYPGMALGKENSLQANLLHFYYWRYHLISAPDSFSPHNSSAWRKIINLTHDKEINPLLWSQILKRGAVTACSHAAEETLCLGPCRWFAQSFSPHLDLVHWPSLPPHWAETGEGGHLNWAVSSHHFLQCGGGDYGGGREGHRLWGGEKKSMKIWLLFTFTCLH